MATRTQRLTNPVPATGHGLPKQVSVLKAGSAQLLISASVLVISFALASPPARATQAMCVDPVTGNDVTGAAGIISGGFAVVCGDGASVNGQDATAVGANATADGRTATALGNNATASGFGATATGPSANANGGSATTPGITSKASSDTQGDVQGLVTTDSAGNLASDGGRLQRQVNTNSEKIAKNASDIDKNTEGIAMSMAIAAAIPLLYTGESFAMSGSWGTFEGENGLAFGARMRVTDRFSVAGGVSAGLDSVGGAVSGRIGW